MCVDARPSPPQATVTISLGARAAQSLLPSICLALRLRLDSLTGPGSPFLQGSCTMDPSTSKAPWATVTLLLLLLVLPALLPARAAAQPMPNCCRQKTCSCRLYDLLHGAGNHAAGILTLGKRRAGLSGLQGRLQRLLQASGNHAAGILTVGRRAGAGGEPLSSPSGAPGYSSCSRGPGTGSCAGHLCTDSPAAQDTVQSWKGS